MSRFPVTIKEVVWKGVLIENSMWAYPRESSAKEQMRLCYQEDNEQRDISRAMYHTERFSADKMYEQFVSNFSDWTFNPEDEELYLL